MGKRVKDFQMALEELFDLAEKERKSYIEISDGVLHYRVGDYPGRNHRMPTCCYVMKKYIYPEDMIISQPDKGIGASLTIRYRIHRIPDDRFTNKEYIKIKIQHSFPTHSHFKQYTKEKVMNFDGNIIEETVNKLCDVVSRGQIEIYNEFSLQHEIGIILRSQLPDEKIQFERNVAYFFTGGEFIKKEIDISVFTSDKSKLSFAIELKFPRNGQVPEQMVSFCKDILFAEQLKRSGFERSFLIIFADDPLFYSGNGDGIYGYFRQNKKICGSIQKPTGLKDEIFKPSGSYQVQWRGIFDKLKYTIIEANNS